ncbi:hypothetical protein DMZ43_04775 [Meridianimaribacter sp. CL38]|uniref:hypothetical protein n=1 Tax=Meridianimaribacter sp. CL38 TaxID=2213021 RepID=UPI00103BC63F|nr:hypothetical protein [Meridianimaribacter sp. CL38]TBV28357.1 hypothetical protein DMZ43_04775 [Meridianimaribacter sp. CL38]
MLKNYLQRIGLIMLVLVQFSCAKDDNYISLPQDEDPIETSPVVFDIESVPYQTLSEYNFFEGDLSNLNPVYGVLPYDLISPLFSDYAHKKRFVWMPEDVSASYVNDHSVLNFPVGTILIKNFYFDTVSPGSQTKILETRLMILKEEGWVFANYKWNEEQTEANFDLNGSFEAFSFTENNIERNVNYRIPAEAECLTCHKSSSDTSIPIGPKPQNLNKSFLYEDGTKNQLQKWIEMGYLTGSVPQNIYSVVDWSDESEPLELRVRSYLDINCAHCHSDDRHCDYRPVRFAFNESEDITNLGVCVEPHTVIDPALTYIVSPGNIQRSVIPTRLNTTEESLRMPLLGRTLIHKEGVDLIEEWINSLNTICE